MKGAPAGLLSLIVVLGIATALVPRAVRAAGGPAVPRRYVSAAGEELLMEMWSQGKLRDHPLARSVAARRAAEAAHDPRADARAEPLIPLVTQALGPDAIANDRSLSACSCNGLPVTQAEPSVAAWGPYVVASWNDRRLACEGGSGGRQGHAYSTDYGASFHEGNLLGDPTVGFFRGDPTVAVNGKSGDFYISGLANGIGVVKGSFSGGAFVIGSSVALNPVAGDFYDKSWMAVDSTSGQVYVTWTNFVADGSSQILLQRMDADLNPLGPHQLLRSTPPDVGYAVQVSFPTVGPDGELYVGWHYYYSTDFTAPVSHYEIVRSDDLGETFGPIQVVTDAYWYLWGTPPGNQRAIFAGSFAMAVDHTHGPHRGRLYFTYTETANLSDSGPSGAVVTEVENNDYWASATPFVPGDRVRGFGIAPRSDFFKFTGLRGQVFAVEVDTLLIPTARIRILCPGDTTALANYHALSAGGTTYVTGLPYDGDYYFQVETLSGAGAYAFTTLLDQPDPGDRSRDVRDQFVTYSDDGVTWSAPVRLNDSAPGSDGTFAQVIVDGRGRVHAFWFDWRDDPICGVISEQYMTSSGDGGVTWGANRKITDASSFWGVLASCSVNNQGDYTQMAAAGDHVYSAFPDSRLGDPDIFVDVSRFTSVSQCPDDRTELPSSLVKLDFTLANQGNFDTPLAWRVSDSAGWLSGATPSLEGSQTLAANGGTLVVQATIALPAGCDQETTVVHFMTSDPFIPGFEDTCATMVACNTDTPTQVALVGSAVQNGTVTLRWHGSVAAGVTASISRRMVGGDWMELGQVAADASGVFTFEDRDVPAGRYVYRFALEDADGPVILETPIDVPALAFALTSAAMDPASAALDVSFQLPSAARATLDLTDVAGRIRASREVGALGPGPHTTRLGGPRLPAGVYVVRLSQGGATASRKAVVWR